MTYRDSHRQPGHGAWYDDTMSSGYFKHLWEQVEKPLLTEQMKRLRSLGAQTVLDFACGTGRITQLNESVFDSSYGVDLSAEMLRVAMKRCPRTTFLHADLTCEQPTLPDFDAITAFRFLLNAEPSLRHAALDVFHDRLRPGGWLVVNNQWNTTSLSGLLYGARNRLGSRRRGTTASRRRLHRLLTSHGFVVTEHIGYGALPWLGTRFDVSTARSVVAAERLANMVPPLQRATQHFLIIARKPRA